MLKIGNNASNGGIRIKTLLLYYSTAATPMLNKCNRNTKTKTKTISPSPSPSPVFMNYLISLGLSRQQADPISTKLACAWQNKKRSGSGSGSGSRSRSRSKDDSDSCCWWELWRKRGAKTVSDFNFVANADSVVCFLEDNGFGESHIRQLTLYAPKILVSKVNPTLKPKVQAFLNFGVSPTDLVWLMRQTTNGNYETATPFDVGYKSTILPLLQLFRQVFGTTSGLIYLIHNGIWHDGFRSLSKAYLANLTLLRDHYGIPCNLIRPWIERRLCWYFYGYLYADPKSFKNVVIFIHEKLGVPAHSHQFLPTIFSKAHARIGVLEDKLHSLKQILKSYGWADSDIALLLKNYPHFVWRREHTIIQTLDIVMTKLGYDPYYIASHPILLDCDFETKFLTVKPSIMDDIDAIISSL